MSSAMVKLVGLGLPLFVGWLVAFLLGYRHVSVALVLAFAIVVLDARIDFVLEELRNE